MSLSITGVPLHTRSLTTVASLREDGLWDVRGDVIDLRKCGFVPMTQDIQPSGIIHHMTIHLVVDPLSLRIAGIRIEQPHIAIEASERTGGECCRDPAPRLLALEGEVVDSAFPHELGRHFGGALGCSHLLTLFHAMAAALPRAVAREDEVQAERGERRETAERIFWRSIFIDGYEVDDGGIELSVQLADVHSRHQNRAVSPLDRLHRQEEARLVARVAPPSFRVSALRAAQRVRGLPNLVDARWHDCSAALVPLVGHPVIPGLSRRARDLLADESDLALVRDALLQLAPGHIQVLAAITDRWFARSASEPQPTAGQSAGPPVGAIGGMIDSCYMWRENGPMIAERERAMSRRDAVLGDE